MAQKIIDEKPYFTNIITMNIQHRKETIDATAFLAPILIKQKRNLMQPISTEWLVGALREYGFRFRSTTKDEKLVFLGDICFYLILSIHWIQKPTFAVKEEEKIDIYAPYVYKKTIPMVTPISERDPGVEHQDMDENMMKQEEDDCECLKTPTPLSHGVGIIESFFFSDHFS